MARARISSKQVRPTKKARNETNAPTLKITRNVTREDVLKADPAFTWADNGLPRVRKLRLTAEQRRIARLPAYMR